MWFQQKQSVTDGQTEGETDDWQSDPYVALCFAGATKIVHFYATGVLIHE